MTHICVSKLTIIGSDNGLSPGRRQAIIWTNAGILLIGPLGTNFSESLIKIHTFSFKKMRLKVSTAKWRPSCLCLNVLKGAPAVVCWITVYWLYSQKCARMYMLKMWKLILEFKFNVVFNTVGGIHRHPNGNVSHFLQLTVDVLPQYLVKSRSREIGY